MNQSGSLTLNNTTFAVDDCRHTRFFVFDSDEQEGTVTISFDVWFQDAVFENEKVSPSICINSHETGKATLEELIGCTFRTETIEEADQREDTFYLYEHEPLVKYTFTIVEIQNRQVHIRINGTAIVDGYARPYTTADFTGDFWLNYA